MSKIKIPRSSPSLDMTPMVDLAFLLVTFFMLTAVMRTPEPVIVDTPSSVNPDKLPKNTLLITVDTAGRVFFNLETPEVRINMLKDMLQQFPEAKFSDDEIMRFGSMQSFGMPIAQLPAYIDATPAQRSAMDPSTKGIPIDTLATTKTSGELKAERDQLFLWINFARVEDFKWVSAQRDAGKQVEDLRFAIKADSKALYKKVNCIFAYFQKQDPPVYHFNLITNEETDPNGMSGGLK